MQVKLANGWTGERYRYLRVALGLYLLVHFAMLLPYATELFSSAGVLPVGDASPLFRLFPSVFWVSDAPWVALFVVFLGAALSVFLIAGVRDRVAAVALWYLWACLHARMPLIANPSLPFVGFVLLVHACLPSSPPGLPGVVRRATSEPSPFCFDPQLFAVLWIVMAVGYSYSGYTKLVSPSWVDGSAVRHVLHNPLARPTFVREFLLGLPEVALRAQTWAALFLELAFAPLALIARLRPVLWAALASMHVGLLVLIDFADLSAAMLLVHAFTFDPAWLERRSQVSGGSTHAALGGAGGDRELSAAQ